jgi:transcriptional regulator with XRE-family HTH domain
MSKQTTFGQRLRELRKAKRLTQRQLAEEVSKRLWAAKERRSLDFTYLSKIENDKAQPPSVPLIIELAHVLEADPNELITLAGKAPPGMTETLKESEQARAFFRSAINAGLTEEDWKKLLHELELRTKARENPPKSGN